MPSCIGKIAQDLLFNCDAQPSQGIETNILLINSEDIDRTLTTVTGKVVNLKLKSGTSAVKLEGIKQINSYLSEVIVNTDSLNKFNHTLSARVYDLSADTRAEIDKLALGANLVAVVEKKAKGLDNESAFVVLGFHNGLEISEGTENSAENDGVFVFTLASNELAPEPVSPYIFLETDYDTTKTAFDNALASGV